VEGLFRSDLSIDLGRGLVLKAPVMLASGTCGYGVELDGIVDFRKIGAIISKGVTLTPRIGTVPPRVAETPAGILNAIGLQNPGLQVVIERYAPYWRRIGTVVLVNINGSTVEEYATLASVLDGIDIVKGIEVNISCPNVEEGGRDFGISPSSAHRVVEAVRKSTKKHVMVKLAPNVSDIAEIAKAVEDAGADSISAINTFLGLAIDPQSLKPKLGNVTGGVSGPAIRPMAVYLAWQAAKAVKIPVVGIGGISCLSDALEYFCVGCKAVQVGTATFVDPKTAEKVSTDLDEFISRKNLSSFDAFLRSTLYIKRE
jgi:dihydroorotate dehydrogenase (NAD+) catalytic subunit